MKGSLLASTAILAAVLAAPAYAQSVSAGNAGATALEELVVTAQRREESAQRAPVTVTAVSSETLEKQNVTDFSDLTALLPSTEVITTGGARVTLAIRGIRTNDFSPGAESPVAVSIDGNYIPRMTGLAGLFYDIARVEALPGPQGTLYGRNAAAGAINIITNRPTQEASARVEVETGNYELLRGMGVANIPVTSEFAVRAAFQSLEHTGYDRSGAGSADQKSARLSGLWTHGPASLYVTTDYTVIGGKPPLENDIANPAFDARKIYSQSVIDQSKVDVRQFGLGAQLDYDLGFAVLTAQGSIRNSVESSVVPLNYQDYDLGFKSRAKIGELRLTSKGSDKLQWVVGAFGFDEKQPSKSFIGANPDNPFGAGGTCVSCAIYVGQTELETKSYAFFGQATWSPIETLHLTAGLRYSHDRKNYDNSVLCQVGADGTRFNSACLGPPLSISKGSPASWSSTDYKAGISYDVTKDSLLYATVATGYRAGGSFISPFFPTYDPERVKNYEIGSKNQFFDHRLIVNLDAFIEDYSNFIFTYTVQGDLNPGPGIFAFTIPQADNLGSVRNEGADATVAWLATPDDLVNFRAEYLHSRIGGGSLRCGNPPLKDNGPCVAIVFQNPQGNSLPNTPEWRLTGSWEHTFRLADGATVAPLFQAHWEDGRWMDLAHTPGAFQGSYLMADFWLTYTSANRKWSATAYVQNMGDTNAYQTAGAEPSSAFSKFPSHLGVLYLPPRTYGVKLAAQF